MHPFHRVTHHVSPHKTPSKQTRDRKSSVDYYEREGDPVESSLYDKNRKTSPNKRKELLDARYAESLQNCVSITPIERQPNKINNALKAREMVLWSNNCTELDSNAERLGSNKNDIIEKSLRSGSDSI